MSYCLIPAEAVHAAPVDWLWRGRIPCGGITLLEGEPGGGKSSLIFDLAARLSRGRPMPEEQDATSRQAGVLLFSTEDQATRIREGVQAADADLSRIHIAAGTAHLPEQIATLQADIEARQASMVVFDPAPAFFSGNFNTDQSVRRVLTPLAAMAEQTGAAVILIRHLTKSGSVRALYRGAGSIGLIGAARSSLLVARHPTEPGRRVLAPVKMNLAPTTHSLSFELFDRDGTATLNWIGPSELTADQLIATTGSGDSALSEAVQVLYATLADGPVRAGQVLQLTKQNGVSDRTARRAKEVLGIESARKGFGPGSVFYWRLPPQNELVQRLRERDMTQLLDKLIYGSEDLPDAEAPPREPGTEDLAGGDWEAGDSDGESD